jgi:hypothetical protein
MAPFFEGLDGAPDEEYTPFTEVFHLDRENR